MLRPRFPDWYYRFLVIATNVFAWLGIIMGLIFAAAGFSGRYPGEYSPMVTGLVTLAIVAAIYVSRPLMIRWYGFMYKIANGRYPDA